MNLGQACRSCGGSCRLISGRGCFDDLRGDEIVVSPPSPIVEPLSIKYGSVVGSYVSKNPTVELEQLTTVVVVVVVIPYAVCVGTYLSIHR